MKVLDLRCANGHLFEGWFASEDDFLAQNGSRHIECPMCADQLITRMPSAPRLNLGHTRSEVRDEAPAAQVDAANASAATAVTVVNPAPVELQAMWLRAVQHIVANTEDVGARFAEEARRIHYGEAQHRGIRGQATSDERAALAEEGIEAVPLPMPAAFKGSAH